MAHPHEGTPRGFFSPHTERDAGPKAILALTFLFVLVAVSISAGLVVYTAWHHDLKHGFFALAFAVLSARAALLWCLWHHSCQLLAVSYQQRREGRKPTEETVR